jgi:hypothetical protein
MYFGSLTDAAAVTPIMALHPGFASHEHLDPLRHSISLANFVENFIPPFALTCSLSRSPRRNVPPFYGTIVG